VSFFCLQIKEEDRDENDLVTATIAQESKNEMILVGSIKISSSRILLQSKQSYRCVQPLSSYQNNKNKNDFKSHKMLRCRSCPES
jgi:hypothetical protein